MSWKTAASRYLPAYLMVAPLLISLSGVCSNGLLPDAMLQKAMLACHHEIPFACGEGVSLEAAMTYFLLKMRQLAAKLRSLLASTSEWNALSRKLTQPQRESFLAMLRALQPGFCMECSDETPQKKNKKKHAQWSRLLSWTRTWRNQQSRLTEFSRPWRTKFAYNLRTQALHLLLP